MKDFNEDVNNILLGIRNLYRGCEGIACEDCPLYKAKPGSMECRLCVHFEDIAINKELEE